MLEETGSRLGAGAGCGLGSGVLLEVEVDGTLEVESATLGTSIGFPRPEPEGLGFRNAFSTSLSYTKLSVVAKNGISPDAIFWM